MDRDILHIDINGCYASIELIFRPDLRGKPVAVGGDVEARHGVILAKNEEAKRCGVKTGEALWQARGKCPELVILKPNHALYERYAHLARAIYAEYTDYVEPFGLDEAWMDITHGKSDPSKARGIADEIRCRIKEELRITVSVGVSYNKIFAKLGSDYKKPDKTTLITRENYRDIVWPLPVENLLYVGHATKKRLYDRSIYTIGQLAAAKPEALYSWFGKMGAQLGSFARGEDDSPVAFSGDEGVAKSISNSTTTPRDLVCEKDASIVYLMLCESVAERLRECGLMARTVQIGLRDTSLCWIERQLKLPTPACTSDVLHDAAMKLLRANWRWPKPLRSIGIKATDLVTAAEPEQLTLFSDAKARAKRERLERSVDEIRRRFGEDAIRRAAVTMDRTLVDVRPKDNRSPLQ